MTNPIVEHEKATLEIVDLLQAMVPDCKCESLHVWNVSRKAMGPCSVLAVARSRNCSRPEWFLVCEEYVGAFHWVKSTWSGPCNLCGTTCWELMPV